MDLFYKCTKCGKEFDKKPSSPCDVCGSPTFEVVEKRIKNVKLLYPSSKSTILLWKEENEVGRTRFRIFKEIDKSFLEGIEEPHFLIRMDIKNNKVFIKPLNGKTIVNGNELNNEKELYDGDTITVGFIQLSVVFVFSENKIDTITI